MPLSQKKNEPTLWLGVGYRRGTSVRCLSLAIQQACDSNLVATTDIIGLATLDRKAKEPMLQDYCQRQGWQLRGFTPAQLAQVEVPHPDPMVARQVGTASVAEAAALLAAMLTAADSSSAILHSAKQILQPAGEAGAVTLALAQVVIRSSEPA